MDSFLEIETWYEYEHFVDEVNLLVLERPGYEIDETSFVQKLLKAKRILNFQEFKDSKGKIFILPIDPIEVTSTEVRELIANSEDVSALLDSDVYQFIKDQNLYKEQ